MTAAKPARATADKSVIYVYGVARAARGRQSAPPRLEGIVPDAPVHQLVHARLDRLRERGPRRLSSVPSEFRSALNDTDWLKDRILAHEKALEELRSSDDVVPFRFGTIYLESSHVTDMLARHRREHCARRLIGFREPRSGA